MGGGVRRTCIWMGVGRRMFLEARWRSTAGGNFIWAKSSMGGSRLSPSTMMWNLSRSSCAWPSLSCRIASGGFQPVARLRVYTMPCRSAQRMSGLLLPRVIAVLIKECRYAQSDRKSVLTHFRQGKGRKKCVLPYGRAQPAGCGARLLCAE